jgi:hypothetical protein
MHRVTAETMRGSTRRADRRLRGYQPATWGRLAPAECRSWPCEEWFNPRIGMEMLKRIPNRIRIIGIREEEYMRRPAEENANAIG